jgi:hypothetical protein
MMYIFANGYKKAISIRMGSDEMNEADAYAFLEKTFFPTFFDEITPGIFHNFANPLNGIMGRSKLLQKRLLGFVELLKEHYPGIEEEMGATCTKLIADVNAINGESEKLFGLFRVSAWKYAAMGNRDVENLNVSHLIEAELKFADFCLDFKHNVKKEIQLDKDVPDIAGVTAFLSMAFWTLIRHAMKKLGSKSEQPFCIETGHDDQYLSVRIQPIDPLAFTGWQEFLLGKEANGDSIAEWPDEKKNLCYALLLLKMHNEETRIGYNPDTERLSIEIPHQQKRKP